MPKGYRKFKVEQSRNSFNKERKTWCLTPEEIRTLYENLCDVRTYIQEKYYDNNTLPNKKWNMHDVNVIEGLTEHVKPWELGGHGLDPNEDQIRKYIRALRKVPDFDIDKNSIKAFSKIFGIEQPKYPLSPEDTTAHCDEKRRLEAFAQTKRK